MQAHHAESIQKLTGVFERDAAVRALVLGGSIAHGFARPDSDIDVSVVVDTAEYQRRRTQDQLTFSDRTLCTYEGGYVDGKYVDLEFLRAVAARGSEPARYAYHGSRILFSRVAGLEELLAAIVRYPVEHKEERIRRFAAQLLAWRWYYGEARRQENEYLEMLALQKLVLFGSRIILAANEVLFPYHKWLLRVLASAERQPSGMQAEIQSLLREPSRAKVAAFCDRILDFAGIDAALANAQWPMRFLKDTELRWLTEEPCIDDL
jgi:predicted nucleotidyltransferase